MHLNFDRIFIHRESLNSELAKRVRHMYPSLCEVVDAKPLSSVHGELSAAEFARSKRLLYICRFAGQFFKRCPGSRPGLACCNYFVLNWGVQCDMNCSYCYLQSFINSPLLTIYSNLDDALDELRSLDMSAHALRVGTGETVDSLSLDELTLYSRQLISFFRDYPNWTLEFKTKSSFVDQFLDVSHAGNVVVSWSVNPQVVISHEEHGTASLSARLAAASRCLARGFKVAFHIDPMIWHPDWRESYASLVDSICAQFSPSDVPYMSVGGLRYQPEQRAMMRERFGLQSWVVSAETFVGSDGKLRYDAGLRQEMFSFVMDRFHSRDERWRLFMCMETPETWLKTAGESPFRSGALADLFDPRVVVAAEGRGAGL